MSGIQIPDGTVWAAVSAGFVWLLNTERKLARMMTRKEHEQICDRRQQELAAQLAAIQHTLECQDERSSAHRASISSKLTAISVKIAVLQTQRGNPPTGDTGSHPKL